MKAKQVKENFPDSIIGNDNIIWKKMRENSTIVNYEPFWRGYSLSPGGFNVASMKELNDIISQFILSIDNYNRLKFRKPKDIDEGYGAGFSFTGGSIGGMGGTTRGGFGGANNLGGPNMMYTYEVKPLNHTLEQKPTVNPDEQIVKIQKGSKISGKTFRSNANPTPKRIKGVVMKIVKTEDNSIKYYVIQNEETQTLSKIDPLTAISIVHEPVEYYFDATDNIPSKRKQKIKNHKKIVAETLKESMQNKK